ncbi:HK97 family phage major capsid protein [Bradyrhizobium sp. CIR48]|uniref:phage major capsid protein n=1 Tax=Bradyrhizobium sp. CIR48 TaxID=2663840 RepID=UPI001606C9E0|nr:phage major capsid protein [Bradyrhizobium sp. CIR48]MBB4422309.1 HK97 family phage major capsid protein [Bradyrhizobium sp. CIR48]
MSDRRRFLRRVPIAAVLDERDLIDSGHWFCATQGSQKSIAYCKAHDIQLVRAQNESSNTSGGFLAPVQFEASVFALRELRGAFRATAAYQPMSRDALFVPRRTSGLTAYFTNEASAISESMAGWDALQLVARKLATLTKVSSELDEDAAFFLGLYLAVEAAYAFALVEDNCGFMGDGSSTYDKIRGVIPQLLDGTHNAGKISAAAGHNTFAAIDSSDLCSLIGAVPAVALPGAKWICSQYAYAITLCRLAATSGGIVVMPNEAGRLVPHFMGFPVVVCQSLPQVNTSLSGNVMLLFGDMKLAATLGERRGITLARSEHGQSFAEDNVLYKITQRIDISVHDLGDNTTAGPVVGLIGG